MQLGPYELLSAIGRGGMGVVHRARDTTSGRTVAVKVMAAEFAQDPVLLRRFAQEFAAACLLSHPHIVRGLDFGVDDAKPYLVMELVEGQNLGQRVREAGPLPRHEAVKYALQIGHALQFAHEHKLIHRDVKPENILLTAGGDAKLTDLGLIKDLDAGSNLTRSRACLGTAAYMAPEQFRDARGADARSDLYSLASTLYFALTGLPPFRGRADLTILRKKLKNDFVPPGQIVPRLPPGLDEAICAALAAAPDRRPATCADWLVALKASTEIPEEAPAAVDNRRASRRYPASLGAACRRVSGSTGQWPAEVQDISLTGVRLELTRRFEAGSILTLELLEKNRSTISALVVRVHWVRAVVDRRWSVGCSFNRPLTESDLNTLLECKTATVVLQPADH